MNDMERVVYKTGKREYTISQHEQDGEAVWYSEYYGIDSGVGTAVELETIKDRIDAMEEMEDSVY